MAAYEGLAVGPLSAHNVPDCGRACALHLPKNEACFYSNRIDQKLARETNNLCAVNRIVDPDPHHHFAGSGSDLSTEKSVEFL
jgi:hypothetical protein